MKLCAEIYTDGSCHTQQCVGAWAAVVLIDEQKIVLSGKENNTTHNRMEILAVINAIKYIQIHFKSVTKIKVVSDSQYVIGLVGRQSKFESSDFTTKAGNDIRNIDLVKELLKLISLFNLEFVKIKAHQKVTDIINYNIEVDKLSRQLVREAVKMN
ncbi:MAG: ribonuclease HI [Bacteroidia bacterium]|nr:ribonuclease HI [Bacteroidia bacterium]